MSGKSFIEFGLQFVNREISLEPWQKSLVDMLRDGEIRYPYARCYDENKELRWQYTLLAMRECWMEGKTTVLFTAYYCEVDRPKPKVIFDEWVTGYDPGAKE